MELPVRMGLPVDPMAESWRTHVDELLFPPPPRIPTPTIVVPLGTDPSGARGPTRGAARGRAWRRTSPNRYVPVEVDAHAPAQRIVEVMVTAPDAAATGWASLHLAGARYFEGVGRGGGFEPVDRGGGFEPVPIGFGRGQARRTVPGARALRAALPDSEVVLRHGIRCTTVHRAIFDEVVLRADARAGAVVLAMAYYAELTSTSCFGAWLAEQPRRVGSPFVRRAHALALEGAESPPETEMHLIWTCDAGLPMPLLNHNVHDLAGRFLGRPDLLDPVAGVVGEHDGEHHRRTSARRHDIGREDALRNAGLEYFSIVAGELVDRRRVVERMLAARARALRSRDGVRRWALTTPSGTVPLTLDQRLDRRPPPR